MGSTLARRRVLVLVAALALTAALFAAASASGSASPHRIHQSCPQWPLCDGADGTGAPGHPQPVVRCDWARSPVHETVPGGPGRAVCGTNGGDWLKVTDDQGSSSVWTGAGADVIDVANGRADEVHTLDAGMSTIKVDSCPGGLVDGLDPDATAWKKVIPVPLGPDRCKSFARTSGLRSAQANPYVYSDPQVVCGLLNGQRYMELTPEPQVYAVDSTRNVDFQTVAYSALLYRWNGQQWVLSAQDPWLWDRAADRQFPQENYWRKANTQSRWFVWFTPTQPGLYRVAIKYHWYPQAGVAGHEEVHWIFWHFGPFEASNPIADVGAQQACYYPDPSLPSGTYTGTSDEQQPVSFTVGPLFQNAPSTTAWSTIEELHFGASVTCSPPTTTPVHTITTPSISIRSDGTFAYSYSGPITSTTGAFQDETMTYFVSGKIDTAGNALGTVQITQAAYSQNGVLSTCTGGPHTWSARLGGS